MHPRIHGVTCWGLVPFFPELPALNDSIRRLTLLTVILLVASPISAFDRPTPPDSEPYYFYHGLDYGSQSLIHPLRLVINGGYGIMQISNRHNRPLDIDYAQGWHNVWQNLLHPVTAIEQEGWWDFFQREIIPVSARSVQAHYWPNYTQHLIGGGMSYRQTMEWYRWHGYEHPKAWASTTLMLYHFLNEVVENDTRDTWTTDPIADLYIFDPASILLFSNDGVSRFFSETLNMADWSYQPLVDIEHQALINNGQSFALKWKLPWTDRWSLFYHWGTHGEFGTSYTWGDGQCLSFGAGLNANQIIELTQFQNGVDLAVSGGIFYDRNNSLMASLLMARTKDNRVRVNIYPGLVEVFGLKPGFFVGSNRNNSLQAGISFSVLPLGLGFGSGPKDE